jgi:hypothetical protein
MLAIDDVDTVGWGCWGMDSGELLFWRWFKTDIGFYIALDNRVT